MVRKTGSACRREINGWSAGTGASRRRIKGCSLSLSLSVLLLLTGQRSLRASICIYLPETQLSAGVKGSAVFACSLSFGVCNVHVNSILWCECVLLCLCVHWHPLPSDLPSLERAVFTNLHLLTRPIPPFTNDFMCLYLQFWKSLDVIHFNFQIVAH